jgi:hypothetical protein
MKELYDRLAAETLSGGITWAWANMKIDDEYRARAAAGVIRSLEPKTILEIAAGYGFVTSYIKVANPDSLITCLEIATPFCKELESQKYEVIEADFRTADLKGRRWNVVTIMQVLEHLKSLEELQDVIARLATWTEDYLFVEIPTGGPLDGERHILALTYQDIELAMAKASLRVEEVYMLPPQGKQIENGYTAMVQMVGRKYGH